MSTPFIDRLIVFTDLDGTLLDHETYSHAEALPAIDRLRCLGIPLILASSKTAAEIIPLREALGLSHCEAIVENGAGILEAGPVLDNADEAHADDYRRILGILNELPPALRNLYQGFSDWSVDEVAARTGLTHAEATRARQRRFSEPGLWLGCEAEREEFITAVKTSGLSVKQGGRFMTLSFGCDKAERMIEIAERHAASGEPPFIVALGDAENDIAMIERASLGIIIPNPAHDGICRLDGEDTGRIIRADLAGPAGWNKSIASLLDRQRSTWEN